MVVRALDVDLVPERNEQYTQEELEQAEADANAAKDQIITQKDQEIADLNTTITSMFTQEELNQAVNNAIVNALKNCDVNGDGQVRLEEAIHALQAYPWICRGFLRSLYALKIGAGRIKNRLI